MNLQERLEAKKKQAQKMVAKINALESQKQQLLQEAVMLNGEIRLLTQMIEEEKKPE
ncbi:MAG: hypothetical protein WC639_04810 [Patescibacteria group bacterium]|jgi:hypothetical protein